MTPHSSYESPCGVMSVKVCNGVGTLPALRIPMWGYEASLASFAASPR